ncbi:MAG: MmcQ/YjbR family DNA-binding protein [Gammaproteobacteria bacterium]|nr:MmcQ/YjbR family DNA-binding protein [Gammaproteobacteria bacterium]
MGEDTSQSFQWLADLCAQADGAVGDLMWGDELVYKVGESMFCIFKMEGNRPIEISFRPDDSARESILATPGVLAAPFPANCGWVAMKTQALRGPHNPEGISPNDLEAHIQQAYLRARKGFN